MVRGWLTKLSYFLCLHKSTFCLGKKTDALEILLCETSHAFIYLNTEESVSADVCVSLDGVSLEMENEIAKDELVRGQHDTGRHGHEVPVPNTRFLWHLCQGGKHRDYVHFSTASHDCTNIF